MGGPNARKKSNRRTEVYKAGQKSVSLNTCIVGAFYNSTNGPERYVTMDSALLGAPCFWKGTTFER